MDRYKIIQKELIHRWIGAYLICHLEYKFYSNLFVRNKKNLLTKKMKTFYTMGVFVLIQVKSRSILILPLDSINRYSNNIIFYDLPHTTKIISNQQAGRTFYQGKCMLVWTICLQQFIAVNLQNSPKLFQKRGPWYFLIRDEWRFNNHYATIMSLNC